MRLGDVSSVASFITDKDQNRFMVLNNSIKKQLVYWGFVAPLFVPFLIFFIIPFIIGVFFSFINWDGISQDFKFVGLGNYIKLFTADKYYFHSMFFTFKYVILVVVLTNLLGMVLAFFLDMKIIFKTVLRAAFFLPNVISPIITGFIWIFIFTQGSQGIFKLTNWSFINQNWLSDPELALFSMVLVAVWQSAGYVMVIYIAGLQSIDRALEEAAAIDGAGKMQRFIHITLPLLMPSISVNLFMTITQAFRVFDLNLSLTQGGPGHTTMSMALDIYKTAFANNRMGFGAAKAVILFLIAFIITLIQIRMTKSREVQTL